MNDKQRISVPFLVSGILFICLAISSELFYTGFVSVGSKLLWTFDRSVYRNIGIYFYDNDYIVSPTDKTSCEYELAQMCALKKELDEHGVGLLYVNKPTKYLDDSIFDEFGVESYCNRNADALLEMLREKGIETLDLREEIKRDGLDIYDMFYRTDHHWTVPSGKWGAMKIAEKLDSSFGYDIDISMYDDAKYTFEVFHDEWLGEQGRKFEGSGIKKDDYTVVKPAFETHYLFNGGETDFSAFIGSYPPCGHYVYSACTVENTDAKSGSVLMLGDSYDVVTEPFLSLGVRSIARIVRRDIGEDDFDVYETLLKGKDIDTVIVCYASFMIGAHDDPGSANYRMFSFVPDERLGEFGYTDK